MPSVDLPRNLRDAIENALEEVSTPELVRATAALSDDYRSQRSGAPVAQTRAQVLAYAAYRAPATYAAASAALLAIAEQRPAWSPRTVLDLGAGLGAATWAALNLWSSIERVAALEAEPAMMELGQELAPSLDSSAAIDWHSAQLGSADLPGQHDLVLLSYVLGELSASALESLIARAWAATSGTLVIIEPGTPPGYMRILAARSQLIGAGGFTTAPCPHDRACPLAGSDWCHFSVRLPRSRSHRAAKGGSLGYEDEKFSYVAISREATDRTEARVLRHPQIRPGNIALELCTRDGLRTPVVGKSQRDVFRQARKAEWGDSFDLN